ncbi:17324_t:CDS:2, partial [Gigaspora rosea]
SDEMLNADEVNRTQIVTNSSELKSVQGLTLATNNLFALTNGLPSKAHILHLYRSLLRGSKTFSNYNFSAYAYRRTRDSFREHKNETRPDKITELVKKAEHELAILQRQGYLNSLYAVDKLVVEQSNRQ